MNYTVTQGVPGTLARIVRRVAATVAECNYAQTRVTSLRNTPGAYLPSGTSPRRRAEFPIRIESSS